MVATLAFLLAVAPAFAFAATINVTVGARNLLIFDPENVAADPGDTVVFNFAFKNHTVTQSSFANPCGLSGTINSGFRPVPAEPFTITVADRNPIWLYCAQGAGTAASHCRQGMVFAINCGLPNSTNSFDNFKRAAQNSGNTSVTTPAGGVTIPPEPTPSVLTGTITLGTSVWTTTYSSYPGSPGPTPAPVPVVHTVTVGGPGKLTFEPSTVVASPRDQVVFEFHQKNHTVTQSKFAAPCVRFRNADGVAGFDSGFMPVPDDATTFPKYTYNVTTTEPVYAYCRQSGHCTAGMVFIINPEPSPRDFTGFQNIAKANSNATSSGVTPYATGATGDASQIKFGFASLLLFPLAFLWLAL